MQVHWHRLITDALAAMRDIGKEGKGPTVRFWVLKALAQLVDFRIYRASDAAVIKAENALLAGEAILRDTSIAFLCRMTQLALQSLTIV